MLGRGGQVSSAGQPRGLQNEHEGQVLGRGGQGVVMQGRDRHLPREVAWKIADEPQAQARLRHEARVVAMLEHPNIVPVYDLVDTGTTVRMATRLVRGRTLRQLLRERAAAPGAGDSLDLVRNMLAVSKAIAFAHEQGVVHRDIKPENIMIGERGATQVIDWGLALIDGDAIAVGEVVGTVAYMSPEQARGERAGPTSDVWSLGATLAEVLLGEALWSQPDAEIILGLRRGERPHLDTSAMAAELAVIIGRSLAPDPESRYADAQTFAADIESYLGKLSERRETPARESRGDETAPLPVTRYAMSGEISLAYQVFGEGPRDLVIVPGFVSHLEISWEDPSYAAFLRRFAEHFRVIFFDKRGTGMSDRVDVSSLGERLEDVRAVMDAAGSERAAILGMSEGGVLAMLFGALYPERVSAMALYSCAAKSLASPDYPMGHPPELFEWGYSQVRQKWGGPVFIEVEAPSRLDDAVFVAWWARYLKMGASPGAAIAVLKANATIDVRRVLPGICVPTLIIHRVDDVLTIGGACQYLAEHIPGARYVRLAGRDHLPFVGDSDAFLEEVLGFFAAERATALATDRVAFLLVAEVVARGAELTEQARDAVERSFADRLTTLGGAMMGGAGPRQLACSFRTSPPALACALAMIDDARDQGVAAVVVLSLDVWARNGAESPPALAHMAEVARNGRPDQVLVTHLVKDFVTRVDLVFERLGSEVDGPDALFAMKVAEVARR